VNNGTLPFLFANDLTLNKIIYIFYIEYITTLIFNVIIYKGFKAMRKTIAIILIAILLMDLTSCHAYLDITEQKDYQSFQDKKNVKVLKLRTKQYKTLYFSEKFPGKISNGEVIGPHHVLLKYFEPDSIIYKNSSAQILIPEAQYALKNGTKYEIILQDYEMLICLSSETTRIPLSEITQMHIKENYPEKSVLLAVGIVGVGIGIVFLIAYLTFDISLSW
jgi:hypothetical protein